MEQSNVVEVGDVVRITDGSYAVRIDAVQTYPMIGLINNDFEVQRVSHHAHLRCGNGKGQVVHDIWIRDTVTNRMYLHSSGMVRIVRKKVRVCACCNRPL